MIGRRIGRFLVLEKLGEGGMATVWKARDELLDRTVALKVLSDALAGDAAARRRFRHEAEVATRLDHPGIAPIYASGDDEGVAYLAMAYVDGETVNQRIAGRLIPIAEATEIVRVAATALGYAHARGVVHRDVTSRNIMVAHDGRVFVLDFGLALAAGISRVTSHGTVLGTIAYMAPEVIVGGAGDVRSDLYGLGVVYYEALTGALPFTVEAPEAMAYAALHQQPRPPRERRPEIPERIERLVLKAMARDPAQRHSSADDLLLDLQAAIAGVSPPEIETARTGSPAARALAEGVPLYLGILPFVYEGAVEDDLDGTARVVASDLTSVLTGALAQVGRVHVVSPGDALPADAGMPAQRAFARRVGAQALLSGSVRRQGFQLHVRYEITDPEAAVRIGGGALGGSATERFDFEDRVIANVRSSLGVPGAPVQTAPRPRDPASSDRYLQAIGNLRRYDNESSVDGAIQLLERLIVAEPEIAKYHATLARACLRKAQHSQEHRWEGRAAEECERALQMGPEDPDVLLALGDLRRSVGRHVEAVEAYEASMRAGGDAFEARLGIASASVEQGKTSEAEEACRIAMAVRPDDWRGHMMLGRILFARGDHAAALEPWSRVVELTPDNARALRNLGVALHRLDRHDEAIAYFERSLSIQPSHNGYNSLGTVLYFVGRHEEAVAALRRATELTPSDPILWGNLAGVCINLARSGRSEFRHEAEMALDRAIGQIRERLARNPKAAVLWAHLAGYLSDRGPRTEAEDAIRKALTLAPADPTCMTKAGYVYYQLGDRAEALRWFREAVHHGWGRGELAGSLELAPLREDPEFRRLLEEGSRGRVTPRAREGESHTKGGRG